MTMTVAVGVDLGFSWGVSFWFSVIASKKQKLQVDVTVILLSFLIQTEVTELLVSYVKVNLTQHTQHTWRGDYASLLY